MKHLESSYKTHDGLNLYLQAWLPDAPKASLLLVHGLGEHSGRYSQLVEKLIEIGIEVFSFDGRGHGKSAPDGVTAFIDTSEDYLKDIHALVEKVQNYISGIPVFIFGHSMGGGLVAGYVLKYKPKVAGVILSSPAIKEAEGTSAVLIAFSGLVNRLFPKLKVLQLDISGISRIPVEVEKYKSDTLVYQKSVPARTGFELYHLMQFIQRNAEQFSSPVLLIHGDADRLTNPKGSNLLYEKASSADKTIRIIPGGYHELLNDLNREEVRELILNWIKSRI